MAKSTKNQQRKPLTDGQIEMLTRTICDSGDDPVGKSKAFLILMDEILQQTPSDEADTARSAAYASLALHDSQYIDAAVQLLRSEVV